MRRKDKEITEKSEIEAVIKESTVCRLAMVDGEKPYVVPMSFGYREGELYFHSALKGMKVDILKKNPDVCFEFDKEMGLVEAESACEFGFSYRSVIGFGKAVILKDAELKRAGLDIIMSQYAEGPFDYTDNAVKNLVVIRVAIDSMTGKGTR